MSQNKFSKIIHCSTPEEFISVLRPSNKLWHGARTGWIFRGQSNSKWKLIPSAFRGESKESGFYYHEVPYFLDGRPPYKDLDEQNAWEFWLLDWFIEIVDSVGMKIPGDSPALRKLREEFKPLTKLRTWPQREFWHALAIAQHHGLPTRLLDFTEDSFVATYFACQNCDLYSKRKTKEICVWAINRSFLERANTYKKRFQVVTVPRYENVYLHVQSGLFLLDTLISEEWSKSTPQNIASIDDILKHEYEAFHNSSYPSYEESFTAIIKIILPASKAFEARALLYREGRHKLTLMPSYQNIIEAMKTERDMNDYFLGPIL